MVNSKNGNTSPNNALLKTNIQRYCHLEKFRKAKTEDCKQGIPSTFDNNDGQKQANDINILFKLKAANQEEPQQPPWPTIELKKEILTRHRPPNKFRLEQNYHHIYIPKQRSLCSMFRAINDDGEVTRGQWWFNCCFCCLCTCF
ncbi:hypothetical protein DERP_006733 [Dermatophagoides pteronyssinus]|uniref:Uncharacterized protein n=1 Tax=Dermatophagoides pteronyssinus TaxID=6956 RepID=A0ABQ8IRU5_DERPT|nr:hypothetical protein DERP_006733 [Dermatophagoides pteronyssinus]